MRPDAASWSGGAGARTRTVCADDVEESLGSGARFDECCSLENGGVAFAFLYRAPTAVFVPCLLNATLFVVYV